MFAAIKKFFIHWLPNIVLVAGLVVLVRFNLSPLAFALLAVSKWQLLLGGPRSWLRNIRDNACDLIVALSAVVGLVLFNDDMVLQIAVAGLYGIWLLLIEPLGGRLGVALQAGICQVAGLSVLFMLGRSVAEPLLIIGAWIIGMAAADHFLSAFDDAAGRIITLGWGLIVAEFSWIMWRWLVIYSLFNGRLLVPQAPLIITIVGYVLGGMYYDHRRKKLRKRRLAEYVLVSFGLLLVVIFGTRWDSRL